ncbi:MAG: hypothetical protein AAGC71_08930 [Pseudomonadota bacterium]
MRFPFVASAAAIGVFVIGLQLLDGSGDETIANFRNDYAEPAACLNGAAERIVQCDSKPCFSGVSLFVRRCLNDVTDDKVTFCRELATSADRGVFADACPHYELDAARCARIVDYAHGYCKR